LSGFAKPQTYKKLAMPFPAKAAVDALKKTWRDKFVRVKPGREDLKRFEGRTGRIVTVNYAGKAIVDFGDGGWYDIDDFENAIEVVEGEVKFDTTANSAQKSPARQA
jgi:hypothetical protein